MLDIRRGGGNKQVIHCAEVVARDFFTDRFGSFLIAKATARHHDGCIFAHHIVRFVFVLLLFIFLLLLAIALIMMKKNGGLRDRYSVHGAKGR